MKKKFRQGSWKSFLKYQMAMVKITRFVNGKFYYFHKSKGRVFDYWKFKVWTLTFKIIYADHTEKRLAYAI